MHIRVYSFLKKNNILYKHQYGFQKDNSTVDAVTQFIHDTLLAIDNKQFTIGIFLDLSKAFDTIDHSILVENLPHYGMRGLALKWFKSYLSNRQQYVKYNKIY